MKTLSEIKASDITNGMTLKDFKSYLNRPEIPSRLTGLRKVGKGNFKRNVMTYNVTGIQNWMYDQGWTD